jgi:hypothetical protein
MVFLLQTHFKMFFFYILHLVVFVCVCVCVWGGVSEGFGDANALRIVSVSLRFPFRVSDLFRFRAKNRKIFLQFSGTQ